MLGTRERARDQLEQSLAIAREVGSRQGEAAAHNNLGAFLRKLGRPDEALEHYELALTIQRDIGDRRGQGIALDNLGLAYRDLGRFQEALDSAEHALAVLRDVGDRAGEATALNNIGLIFANLGRPDDALKRYEHALAVSREVGTRATAASLLRNIGVELRRLGRLTEALEVYELSLSIGNDGRVGADVGATLANMAVVYAALGRSQDALDNLEQASTVLHDAGDLVGAGITLANLGLLSMEVGRPQAASDYLARALPILQDVGDRRHEAVALHGFGRLHRRSGRGQEALECYERAVELVSDLRGELASEELKTSFFATAGDLYAEYVSVLVEEGEGERAFHVAERGKARAFVELLAEAGADIRAGVDPALRDEEQRLLSTRAVLRQRLIELCSSADSEPGRLRELEREEQALELAFHRNQAEILRRTPNYAALTQPIAASVGDVRGEDGPVGMDTALLAYVLSEPNSFGFLVSRDCFRAFALPARAELEASVKELRAAVVGLDQRYPHGHALYQALIAPVEDMIAGKELLICADGALHYLPFALLLTERIDGGADWDWSRLPYLVRRHALRYAPSATVALLVHRAAAEDRDYDAELAAFADPGTAASDMRGTSVAIETALVHTGHELRPIPKTAEEVSAVAALVSGGDGGSTIRTGPDATKEAVESVTSDERSYRFFHVATHGLLDPEKPEFSGLVFTATHGEDPFWRTFEIFNARIPAELAVLSACETGLGRIVSGEGIVGLTRAFMYAGARAVCVSLWKVADASSPPLMRAFYEGVLAGRPKAEALRDAQLELLDHSPYVHPFWWAPFVLVGEG